MAEKFAVLIKYKYLEYIENAKLSDADAWVFIKGLIEYDKQGIEPKFENQILSGLFAVLKCDLDENKEKWEETIKSRSEAGKKGMEKRWRKKEEEITDDNTDNTCYQMITPITKITDLDLDSVISDKNIKPDAAADSGLPPPVENSGTSPPAAAANLLNIQRIAKSTGYFLAERQAAGFLTLNDTWLSGRYNFFVFASEKINDDLVYSRKPKNEQERIFAKGWQYQSWLQEYPEWLNRQIKAESLEAERFLRETPPAECPNCGTVMNGKKCPACNGWIDFDEETKAWKYQEPFDFDLSESFKNLKKRIPKPG